MQICGIFRGNLPPIRKCMWVGLVINNDALFWQGGLISYTPHFQSFLRESFDT